MQHAFPLPTATATHDIPIRPCIPTHAHSHAHHALPPSGWVISHAKRRIIDHFQANNARSAPFFCVYVGVSLVNNISARKFSRRQMGGPTQPLARAGFGERKWVGGGMVSDSRSLLSAGECLVVSTVALCGAKPNSLTQLGSVVLPLLKITM